MPDSSGAGRRDHQDERRLSPLDTGAVASGHVPAVVGLLPGLALVSALTLTAFALRKIPGVETVSPMMLAIMVGILFRATVGTPAPCKPGLAFSVRRILRAAVVLLGLQLSLGQIAAIGFRGFIVVGLTLVASFLFTTWLGRRMRVEQTIADLLAAGTSICGASAVIAANTVTKGSDEDVAYAIACVTLFGSLSMFLYPLLPDVLHLAARDYGLWTGSSIHEVAQVIAAAFQNGHESGDVGTIAKLTRVALLAPTVLLLAYVSPRKRRQQNDGDTAGRSGTGPATAKPWFVAGFVAMMLVNSVAPLPHQAISYVTQGTAVLLTIALGAMGLQTDIGKLRARGWKPFVLAAASWLFIAMFALLLIKLALA
jgi:uncharacterized integral membrane protein (TIGR00698 family)